MDDGQLQHTPYEEPPSVPPIPAPAPAAAAANASSSDTTAISALNPQPTPVRKQRLCRYYGSGQGCRDGANCRFLHDESRVAGPQVQRPAKAQRQQRQSLLQPQGTGGPQSATPSAAPDPTRTSAAKGQHTRRHAPDVQADRVVQRPVPRAEQEDPRGFQLAQVRRRYAPTEHDAGGGATVLEFTLMPSDPDFPYELDKLQCALTVPHGYPGARAGLRVRNKDMPRGYQINVEQGFDSIFEERPGATLLQALNLLDRRLEQLLAAPKTETIKLVANVDRPGGHDPAQRSTIRPGPASVEVIQQTHAPAFTPEEVTQAARIREAETRQLEARLGRMPLFSKSTDGRTYTVPIEPRRRGELPLALQPVKAVKLTVPAAYNLEQCAIDLVGVDAEEAGRVEAAFSRHISDSSHLTLLNHMNYLAQHMHDMAKQPPPQPVGATPAPQQTTSTPDPRLSEPGSGDAQPQPEDDRAHIVRIARPPEWAVGVANPDDGDDGSSDSYSYDSGDETEDGGDEAREGEQGGEPAAPVAERGILLSFPHLELYGIELLELVSLCIIVKCDRCKDTLDVANLKNNERGDYAGMRSVSCKKCANPFAIGYRMDLLHANCVRAGYLDLDGCSVVDLLPSNFVPTCAECSAPHPIPGLVAVRGESSMALCRECHRKMTFSIPEVKFLQVSANAERSARAPLRKKPKERLGIVAGTELPRRGRCSHYGKSYRWFRFSCCSRVFPCDRCHDAAVDHPNEHANRMICGYCSREQNYDPEVCRHCRSTLTGRTGTGFWEGGKGTRDKARMSRKDPRKYKRRPGTKPKA